MSDKNKSFGESVGGMVDKAKDAMSDAGKSVKNKSDEAGHRSSAEAHDAQAETSDNVFDKAEHKVKGGVDRTQAEGDAGKAEYHEEKAKSKVKSDH